jgi:hypothetical protein
MPTDGGDRWEPGPASRDSFVERQIREAMERGEFDHLPGAGKPIPDLDAEYDPGWWARRWVERHRRADRALELAREADRVRARARVPSLAERAEARLAELEHEIAELDAGLPPSERIGPTVRPVAGGRDRAAPHGRPE